jgi:hypothetical protein
MLRQARDEGHVRQRLHPPSRWRRHGGCAKKRCNATGQARRRVVEISHSWFSRFRKRLVRCEKLERSFLALNHLTAAIMALRRVHLKVNMFHGLTFGEKPCRVSRLPTGGSVHEKAARRRLGC